MSILRIDSHASADYVEVTGGALEAFDEQAERSYRAMVGMDLPMAERTRRARAIAPLMPTGRKTW